MDALAAIGCQEDADIRIDEAALHLAAADRTRADLEPSLAYVRGLAARLPLSLPTAGGRAQALADLLAVAEGFTGDAEDYDSPRSADMLCVLSRRRGLPVALAILYVATARRAGWDARAMGLPGHVLVALEGGGHMILIDAFAGGRLLAPSELARMPAAPSMGRAQRTGGASLLGNRETLVRLVMNQAGRARASGDHARALTLYRRLTGIAPAMPWLWWERARLEQASGDTPAARRSLAAMRETTLDPDLKDRIRQAYEALTR
jgi:regulator of sirC expression with transglutaminase-like and TPR domain